MKLVKNPKLPMLIGKIGIPRGVASRAVARIVPSPPSTSSKSDSSATCCLDFPSDPFFNAVAVSVSYTAGTPCSFNHSNNGGTTSTRFDRRGREIIPIVLNMILPVMDYADSTPLAFAHAGNTPDYLPPPPNG